MTERHTQVSIRSATAFDAVNIAKLLKAAWEPTQAAEAVQVNDQRALEYITGVLKDSHSIVADVSGRLVGALACALMRERWSRSDDWFLVEEWFVISPNWIARGLADQLLVRAEAFADQQHLPLLLGGSLMYLAPAEPLLNHRPGYQRLNAQYLRMPQALVGDETAATHTRIEAQPA